MDAVDVGKLRLWSRAGRRLSIRYVDQNGAPTSRIIWPFRSDTSAFSGSLSPGATALGLPNFPHGPDERDRVSGRPLPRRLRDPPPSLAEVEKGEPHRQSRHILVMFALQRSGVRRPGCRSRRRCPRRRAGDFRRPRRAGPRPDGSRRRSGRRSASRPVAGRPCRRRPA